MSFQSQEGFFFDSIGAGLSANFAIGGANCAMGITGTDIGCLHILQAVVLPANSSLTM